MTGQLRLFGTARQRHMRRFDGPDVDAVLDEGRLDRQYDAVFGLMRDGQWRTLAEISAATGAPESSVSARLRDMRKVRFGAHVVNRRRRGDGQRGLWEYQVAT